MEEVRKGRQLTETCDRCVCRQEEVLVPTRRSKKRLYTLRLENDHQSAFCTRVVWPFSIKTVRATEVLCREAVSVEGSTLVVVVF
ncbi:hypothetical protein BaRGS_00004890 [Batillaria attramentaria]|uniref:Uncharacterized protein n=1 Tax=Batillaria attramentaria TaxID=370345 RepID=A0ABD0LWN7_9CAEN